MHTRKCFGGQKASPLFRPALSRRTAASGLGRAIGALSFLIAFTIQAQDTYSAAQDFRDGAQSVYQGGAAVCADYCEPDMAGALANLGSTLGPLDSALASHDDGRIQSVVANTASTLPAVCTAFHVACPSPYGAASFSITNDAPAHKQSSTDSAVDCYGRCDQDEWACWNGASSATTTCIDRINEFIGCRLETPFCGYQGLPFDAGAYARCLSSSYYRALLQPCRCQNPPGLGERQGGCQHFFTQQTGDVTTSACEVSDGLGCARCCESKCVGADPRQSCRGSNREECDVCEWSRRTILAGQSMRTSLCSNAYYNALLQCQDNHQTCYRECYVY